MYRGYASGDTFAEEAEDFEREELILHQKDMNDYHYNHHRITTRRIYQLGCAWRHTPAACVRWREVGKLQCMYFVRFTYSDVPTHLNLWFVVAGSLGAACLRAGPGVSAVQ